MDFNTQIVLNYGDMFLLGALATLKLTAISVAVGIVIGLFVALGRLSSITPLRWLAAAYTDLFRGTPLLVQILIIHYGIPKLTGVPNEPLVSGLIALSLNSGAYVAEIVRAGIQSIDKGQMEASRSLGMTHPQAMRHIILPQAFRRIIPPLGNEFIAMLKDSSLVSVIALQELTMTGRIVYGKTAAVWEAWIPVAVLYLVMTFLFSRLVNWYEKKLQIKSHR